MKRYIYFFLAALLTLASCESIEDWVYRPVDYQGNALESKLVVSAHLRAGDCPQIFVNTAYFIEDSLRITTDTFLIWQGENGELRYDIANTVRKGYLHEAEVQMRVNGGNWLTLTEQSALRPSSGNTYGAPTFYRVFFYTCSYLLQPGDSVELQVYDPSLHASATAAQRIPDRVTPSVSGFDTIPPANEYQDHLLQFSLSLPACARGSDLLRIRTTSYLTQRYRSVWQDYDPQTGSYTILHDSVFVYTSVEHATYGQDVCFARYGNVCATLSQGWYGSRTGLFMDAPAQQQTIPMCAIFVPEQYTEYGDGSWSLRTTDSIVVEVSLVTREAYLYASSMVAAGYYGYDVYDFWEGDVDNPADDIIEIIEDLFNEMGTLEAVPIYGNVTGAIGHVTADCPTRLVLHP